MCGIVGAASGFLSPGEVDIFTDLMMVSNLRGKQGAGVIMVYDKGQNIQNLKTTGNGIDVCEMETFKKLRVKQCVTLVGHTRHPTRGGVEIKNVHPHAFREALSGVHNGTMTLVNDAAIPTGASDSKELYGSIVELGLKEAISKASGAYCLVWIDYKTRTLNFLRNSQRPMWFAKVNWETGGRTLYWASEKAFLELVLGRNRLNATYEELPVNEHWSIPVGLGAGTFEVEKDVRPFVAPTTTRYYHGHAWEGGDSYGHWYESVPFSGAASKAVTLGPAAVGPKSNSNSSPAIEGKQTFVMRNGVLVRKGQDASDKKVTLSGGNVSVSNVNKGAQANVAPLAQTNVSQELVKQRASSAPQIRDHSGRFVALNPPVVHISADEADFNRQMKEAVEWRQHVDERFNDLVARQTGNADYEEEDDSPAEDPVTLDKLFGPKTTGKFVETVRGHYLRDHVAEKVLKHGCAWCGDAAQMDDKVHWVAHEDFLCESCGKNEEALRETHMIYPFAEIMEDWKNGKIAGVNPPEWASGNKTRTLQ